MDREEFKREAAGASVAFLNQVPIFVANAATDFAMDCHGLPCQKPKTAQDPPKKWGRENRQTAAASKRKKQTTTKQKLTAIGAWGGRATTELEDKPVLYPDSWRRGLYQKLCPANAQRFSGVQQTANSRQFTGKAATATHAGKRGQGFFGSVFFTFGGNPGLVHAWLFWVEMTTGPSPLSLFPSGFLPPLADRPSCLARPWLTLGRPLAHPWRRSWRAANRQSSLLGGNGLLLG